jgi:cation diffusion facilitator CzcD-associated flavoprotein CzcO
LNVAFLRDRCEVAVIGAGPYGLAVAAHLKAAGIATRVFGEPMSFWREHMPKGMKLRSPWDVTHIPDPERRYTLNRFIAQLGIERREPLPLDDFVRYGEWFQRLTVPDLDRRKVVRIEPAGRGYCVLLADGEALLADRVVIATGLARHAYRPPLFDAMPAALVSHSSMHTSLDRWRGKRVAVVGRGQGAVESTALLSEAGTHVDLIARGEIDWLKNPEEVPPNEVGWHYTVRSFLSAPSRLGPFPMNWLNAWPALARRVPARLRGAISRRSLRPSAEHWLRPRMRGVQVHAGRTIAGARRMGNQIGIELDTGLRVYDHVLLATGYRVDIANLGILAPDTLGTIAARGRLPVLSAGFESSVPGLHFAGASAMGSFGPLMQVVAGAGFAARSITRAVVAQREAHKRDKLAALGIGPFGASVPVLARR